MKNLPLMLFLAVLLALLCGCRKQQPPAKDGHPPEKIPVQTTAGISAPDAVDPEAQLMCSVENRDAAQKLAELYGIVLVDYQEGFACFYTQEDPREVIKRGAEQGWPLLSLNRLAGLL